MTVDEEKLVVDNMNLAHDIAWRYCNQYNGIISFDDLKSSAYLGLIKAAKTFNADLNYTFSTYAYKCIRNEILMYLSKNVKSINDISLYEQIDDAEDVELIDTLSDELDVTTEVEKTINITKLLTFIDELPNRQRKILKYRLKNLTFMEIASILGLSQSMISYEYKLAINLLRSKFKLGEEDL